MKNIILIIGSFAVNVKRKKQQTKGAHSTEALEYPLTLKKDKDCKIPGYAIILNNEPDITEFFLSDLVYKQSNRITVPYDDVNGKTLGGYFEKKELSGGLSLALALIEQNEPVLLLQQLGLSLKDGETKTLVFPRTVLMEEKVHSAAKYFPIIKIKNNRMVLAVKNIAHRDGFGKNDLVILRKKVKGNFFKKVFKRGEKSVTV